MDTKFCTMCDTRKPVNEFYQRRGRKLQPYCKECLCEYQCKRWKDRKRKAVQIMGGKCVHCGYSKCLSAMEFHHVDPEQKEISIVKAARQSWEKLVEELKKCILLCANCHREEHADEDLFIFEPNDEDNRALNRDKIGPSRTGSCPVCNKEVFGTKYCSVGCSSKATRRVERPSKEELAKELESRSWVAIGRRYGVSDNAVRKWARSYKIL